MKTFIIFPYILFISQKFYHINITALSYLYYVINTLFQNNSNIFEARKKKKNN